MLVSHMFGKEMISGPDDVARVMEIRDAQGANELWFSGDAPYPCLVVQLCGADAAVHYFPEDGHPGFQSCASEAGDEDGTVRYYTVNGEPVDLPASSRVGVREAALTANAFMAHPGVLPSTILWQEL